MIGFSTAFIVALLSIKFLIALSKPIRSLLRRLSYRPGHCLVRPLIKTAATQKAPVSPVLQGAFMLADTAPGWRDLERLLDHWEMSGFPVALWLPCIGPCTPCRR